MLRFHSTRRLSERFSSLLQHLCPVPAPRSDLSSGKGPARLCFTPSPLPLNRGKRAVPCHSTSQLPGGTRGSAVTARLRGRSDKTAACHFPEPRAAPALRSQSSSDTELTRSATDPTLQGFSSPLVLHFGLFFSPQKAISCFTSAVESGWVNGRGKNKDMRI